MRTPRVLVLVLRADRRFRSGTYLLREWRAQGIDVEVASDLDRIGDADVVIPHLDVTTTPPAYRDALKVARHLAGALRSTSSSPQ